jgi:peptide-methionine (S)-S-oxide reductase
MPQRLLLLLAALPLAAFLASCNSGSSGDAGATHAAGSPATPASAGQEPMTDSTSPATELATFGAGCFWCVEAVFDQLEGVEQVVSGYMGGAVENPSYREVCTGETGHAEVVQLTYDPARISYGELLDWFWRLHDPTTLDRQGADIGTQYRSAIFHHSDAQRQTAERSLAEADASGAFDDPIVTEISAASTFYPAEDHHQDYYAQNRAAGYCQMVIRPKLKKLGLKD